MKRRHHTPEQVVRKLREADRLLGEGVSLVEVCKHLEVTEQTYCRWRNQLDRVERHRNRRPPIPRRPLRRQRPTHRVPRDPQSPRNRLDRHSLRPMQTTDPGPVLHTHPSSIVEEGVHFPHGTAGSVFSRRRQLRWHDPPQERDSDRPQWERSHFLAPESPLGHRHEASV